MGILKDVRFALRLMRRSPGFTLAVVAILALGIGANASIFTLADAVLLRQLPVPEPDALVLFGWSAGKDIPAQSFYGNLSLGGDGGRSAGNAFSAASFDELRAESAELAELFAFAELERVNVGAEGRADLAGGMLVSGNYFTALGVGPAVGRMLTADDDRVGSADSVAVLSHRYWTRRFGRDPAVVGRVLRLNGTPFTVVGVAARGFAGTLEIGVAPDLFVPIARQPQMMPGAALLEEPGAWWLQVMGRLAEGGSTAGAVARLEPVLRRSRSIVEEQARGEVRLTAAAGGQGPRASRATFSRPIVVLSLLVGVVLLVGCANVAALVLARAEGRRKEIAVRMAIGASRARLVRQLLTESVLLAFTGGAAGLLLARWGEDALPAFLPAGSSPLVLDLAPGGRVLAFTTVVAIATGILFGLIPAFRATRGDLLPELKHATGRRRRSRLPGPGDLLVVAQVALSLVLTLGGALFVRTLVNLEREDVGFNASRVLVFKLDPTLNHYGGERLTDLYARILAGIDALPGVLSASLSQHAPLDGSASIADIAIPGSDSAQQAGSWVHVHKVRPNFLATMEIPLLRGRALQSTDVDGSAKVAVVSENLARAYFPDQDPLGRQVRLGSAPTDPLLEIVGVAGDARYARLRDGNPPTLFVPYAQHPGTLGRMTFEIRTAGDPVAIVRAVRQVVDAIDPNLPLFDVRTQEEQVARSIAAERQFSRLALLLAAVGLLLAAVGLYGTLAYGVSRRRREIGIRMALGACGRDVLRMVLGQAVRLAGIGTVLGIVVALAAGRIVASLLYGLEPTDAPTLIVVTAILVLVSLCAGYLPARNASRVDPAHALRCE